MLNLCHDNNIIVNFLIYNINGVLFAMFFYSLCADYNVMLLNKCNGIATVCLSSEYNYFLFCYFAHSFESPGVVWGRGVGGSGWRGRGGGGGTSGRRCTESAIGRC